eukprot:TRINITY_DN2611_c1_g1_i1.p1 TRINITY_DN2611_c1_g1~~TRINITY_DN2611_c1_g1_i1.p1  ORF type:complete len:551 (-),score=100.12 TRINITY_DN2611_c1_g1_i1:36-1688(-)
MKRRMSHHSLNLGLNGAPISCLGSSDTGKSSENEWMQEEERRLAAQIEEITLRLQLMKAQQQRTDEEESKEEHLSGFSGRLIMASNRLPVTITKTEDGSWSFSVSSGGLVTALSGLKQQIPFLWVGWVGLDVPKEEEAELARQLEENYGLFPVFLNKDLVDKYYNGFCNDILWPLFHYTPLPMFQPGRDMKFDSSQWDAYKEANLLFAEVIAKAVQPGDLVWIHDYHLMMAPAMLREIVPNVTVGWFLHTPFPASDVYRVLPMRLELLQGVLMADLLGFHTYDYSRHFVSCCTKLLNLETTSEGIMFERHHCRVGVFPIGIDPEVFESTMSKPEVQKRIAELRRKFKGYKVLIGVDRLDYIKGMPHRLAALETLLRKYPQWREKVVLVQIAVPSRTAVIQYKQLCSEVNEMVGRINGRYGNFNYSPVHYLFRSVCLEELCALYAVADVCIVSSVRDGMNLVSHEYVVCQKKKCGVLILSEFAGAAQSLHGAICVNPWDSDDFADAIHRALTLSKTERQLKELTLYKYVTKNTASFWGTSFVGNLIQTFHT